MAPVNLTGVTNATAVNQVVTGTAPTTASTTTAAPIAFVTYTTPSTATTAAQLPLLPAAGQRQSGPVGYVKFADASSATPPTAPLAGAFSPDNSIFFVSTAGDNEIHFISIPTNVSTRHAAHRFAAVQSRSAGLHAGFGGRQRRRLSLSQPRPRPNTVVPATVITVKPRSVT